MQNWTQAELEEFAMACADSPAAEPSARATPAPEALPAHKSLQFAPTVRRLNRLYADTPRGALLRSVDVAKMILKRALFDSQAEKLNVIAASHFGLSYRQRERDQLSLIERDIEFVTAGDKADGQVSQTTRIAVRPVIGGGRQIVRESFEDEDACVLAILSVEEAFRLRQLGIDLAAH